ncbi:hypothetical protein AMTRI_Chr03g141420 [Amborella trichopoda]
MTRAYNVKPKIEHYGCMVDLLGRAGLLDEAHEFILDMPMTPNVVILGALLGACRNHNNLELAKLVEKQLEDLNCRHSGCYALMCNLYASNGEQCNANNVRSLMRSRGIKKEAGCSSQFLPACL